MTHLLGHLGPRRGSGEDLRPIAWLASYPYAFGNYPGECRWRESSANWRQSLLQTVVGYSRLMGRDESGTLARLRKNRSEHLNPVLTKYGGRLVKLTGDGALIEFASRRPLVTLGTLP